MKITEEFESFCERVASSKDWGGQLELRALSEALRMPILVFAADSPEVHSARSSSRFTGDILPWFVSVVSLLG